jgi:hypothetical protein
VLGNALLMLVSAFLVLVSALLILASALLMLGTALLMLVNALLMLACKKPKSETCVFRLTCTSTMLTASWREYRPAFD